MGDFVTDKRSGDSCMDAFDVDMVLKKIGTQGVAYRTSEW